MPTSGACKLPKAKRLTRGHDFAQPKSKGARIAQGCLIANWLPQNSLTHSRLGVITTRKLGGAVVRNRARRLLRESFRRHQAQLAQSVDLVLIARPSIVGKSFKDVENDLLQVLNRGRLLKTT